MDNKDLHPTFDLEDDYYSGYFSNSKITDIDEKYIGSVVNLEALTKISRQLTVSMGSMMNLINGFAIAIFMVLIYLLSKIIIEKAIMNVLFRQMMLASVSGWIALWINPKIYLEMFFIGIGTYAVVSLLEYRRIRKVPMDEVLKHVE